FDVIVGMDRLSKRKLVIVCHEKVVEIPLEGSRKLRVQGERTHRKASWVPLVGSEMDEAYASRIYHLSIRCAPFEALYRRKYRSPVLWVEIGESSLTRLELVQETIDKILERIGLVADRLRLLEELSCIHDKFHVSNLEKKCLADASLHVPLDENKVDKTLCFVEEPVENSVREVKRLKCSRMGVVKVHLDSK
ncbi:hypothetical protein Tco_0064798, partial [Tanacetum coccineum]